MSGSALSYGCRVEAQTVRYLILASSHFPLGTRTTYTMCLEVGALLGKLQSGVPQLDIRSDPKMGVQVSAPLSTLLLLIDWAGAKAGAPGRDRETERWTVKAERWEGRDGLISFLMSSGGSGPGGRL